MPRRILNFYALLSGVATLAACASPTSSPVYREPRAESEIHYHEKLTPHFIGIDPAQAPQLYGQMQMPPPASVSPNAPRDFYSQKTPDNNRRRERETDAAARESQRLTDRDGFLIPPAAPAWRQSTYH